MSQCSTCQSLALRTTQLKMADLQTKWAYQKQPTIFQNKTLVPLGETRKEKLPHYYKNIGLGIKTGVLEATEGTRIDKKCPFTGNMSICGRILSGVVTKMKMQHIIVIRRDYLHYISKYNQFEKRHKNMSVHRSPCFQGVQIQDIATVGKCWLLSKTVRFNVLKVTKAAGTKRQFQRSASVSSSLGCTNIPSIMSVTEAGVLTYPLRCFELFPAYSPIQPILLLKGSPVFLCYIST
ncbi:hypothetical protein lerEdw1_001252 [Lerista edwardsae]|nr:hypothetical protein lerEdw1_001252 [Lerista edwardsae]